MPCNHQPLVASLPSYPPLQPSLDDVWYSHMNLSSMVHGFTQKIYLCGKSIMTTASIFFSFWTKSQQYCFVLGQNLKTFLFVLVFQNFCEWFHVFIHAGQFNMITRHNKKQHESQGAPPGNTQIYKWLTFITNIQYDHYLNITKNWMIFVRQNFKTNIKSNYSSCIMKKITEIAFYV